MESASPPPPPRSDWALFLDVDGTLVEIADEPDAVVVPPRLLALLRALQEVLGGAVALVSGRAVTTLDALFAPLRLPVAGNHGLERRTADGHLVCPEIPAPALDEVRTAFTGFAQAHEGAIVEDKKVSIALHFRQAPYLAEKAERLAETLVGAYPALHLQRGKMLVELRPTGGNKGSVVHDFMSESPFQGRIPVFIGDDVTDEDGFRAVNALGGMSVRVGDPARPTGARYSVPNIEAVYSWLAGLAGVQAGERTR